jgi:hypothetical protein
MTYRSEKEYDAAREEELEHERITSENAAVDAEARAQAETEGTVCQSPTVFNEEATRKSMDIMLNNFEDLGINQSLRLTKIAAAVRDRTQFDFESWFLALGGDPLFIRTTHADPSIEMFPFEVLTGIFRTRREKFEKVFSKIRTIRADKIKRGESL